MNGKRGGWFGDPVRHSLASQGIKTSGLSEKEVQNMVAEGKSMDEIDVESWKAEMQTEAGATALEEMVNGIPDDVHSEEFDELVAEGKILDGAKDILERGGDALSGMAERAGEFKDYLADKIDDASMKLDEYKTKLTDWKDKVDDWREERKKKKEKLKEATGEEKKKIQTEIEDYDKKIDEEETKIEDKKTKIEDEEKKIKELEDNKDNISDKINKGISWTGDQTGKIKTKIMDKSDKKIVEALDLDMPSKSDVSSQKRRDGLKQKVDKIIDEDRVKDPKRTRKEIQSLIEDGTPKELVDAIRKGETIDANAFVLTGENVMELKNHLSDLRRDLEILKNKRDIMEDLRSSEARYYKKQAKIERDQYRSQWNQEKERIPDKHERAKRKNELVHKSDMAKIKYRKKYLEVQSDAEYSNMMYNLMEDFYKQRKQLIRPLIKSS